MRSYTTMTSNAIKLPEGGIIEAFREGNPGPRIRTFSIRHIPKRDSPKEEASFFHSKSSMPQVAIDYLGLTARLIKPERIILPGELMELWGEKTISSPELAHFEVEVKRP